MTTLKLRNYYFYHKEQKISHKLEVDICNIHYLKQGVSRTYTLKKRQFN